MKGIKASNKYGYYSIPVTSKNSVISQKILNNEVNEQDTVHFITNNYFEGDIVHAGAYFGDFIPFLSKIIYNGNLVWAFEPNHDSFESAKETVELNNITNVLVYKKALGSERNKVNLKTKNKEKYLGGVSKVVNKKSGFTETVDVEMIDNIVASNRKVSIIHLDLEGYEIEALKGSINTIKNNHSILLLEELQKQNLTDNKWFIDNILDYGYKQVGKVDRNLIFKFGD